ncbi:MAG: hypothetical protein ACREON_19525 [Gemmatimonadaceae bacterium]
MDVLRHALAEIRTRAAELRDSFGDEARARALEWAAALMDRALRDNADERLTLAQAALRSGYSPDHLARLLRVGRLPNAGRRGAPRVRAADVPVRPPRTVAPEGSRCGARVAEALRNGTTNSTSAVDAQKHRGPTANGAFAFAFAFAYAIGTAGFEPATP